MVTRARSAIPESLPINSRGFRPNAARSPITLSLRKLRRCPLRTDACISLTLLLITSIRGKSLGRAKFVEIRVSPARNSFGSPLFSSDQVDPQLVIRLVQSHILGLVWVMWRSVAKLSLLIILIIDYYWLRLDFIQEIMGYHWLGLDNVTLYRLSITG